MVTIPKPLSIGEETFMRDMKAYKLSPLREYEFHATRKWKFDFAFPEAKLAIEVEGGTKGKSRHTKHKGFSADCEKYNAAAMQGWMVLRYTTDMVTDGKASMDVVDLMRPKPKRAGW